MNRTVHYLIKPFVRFALNNTRRSRILLVHKDEVLLVEPRLDKQRVWNMPGGGIKKSEDAKEAAAREIAEELGITVSASKLKPLFKQAVEKDGYTYAAEFFVAELPSKSFTKHWLELRSAQWFSLSALPPQIGPLTQRAITIYEKSKKT